MANARGIGRPSRGGLSIQPISRCLHLAGSSEDSAVVAFQHPQPGRNVARVVAARLTGQDQRRGALRQALPSHRILSRSDRTGRGRAGAHRGAKSLTCRGADSSFEVTIEKIIQLFQLFMIVYVSSGGPEIAGLTLAYRAFCANPPPGFGPTRPRSPPALVPWGRCLCVAP